MDVSIQKISIRLRDTRDTDIEIGRSFFIPFPLLARGILTLDTAILIRMYAARRRGYVDTRVRILASQSRGSIS